MSEESVERQRERMNDHYRQVMVGLFTNAERDVRLARAGSDPAALAKAQARFETLKAALDIYAAAHLAAYGERPWPRMEPASP